MPAPKSNKTKSLHSAPSSFSAVSVVKNVYRILLDTSAENGAYENSKGGLRFHPHTMDNVRQVHWFTLHIRDSGKLEQHETEALSALNAVKFSQTSRINTSFVRKDPSTSTTSARRILPWFPPKQCSAIPIQQSAVSKTVCSVWLMFPL
jgi:hypothetical protein